ncbi:MAG: pyruvate kinase [Parcubacteria bacterium C7867-006]|nr:MAG: pyruvate kinase [Parcubacteria bacterium C7867-006]
MNSRAQIIATINGSSEDPEIFKSMVTSGLDIARLNFSWGDFDEKNRVINVIRETEENLNRKILIMADLPGPRVQNGNSHTYDKNFDSAITDNDKEIIKFSIDKNIDFIALSFVGSANDVVVCKDFIKSCGGEQRVVSKIERKSAVDNIDEIIKVSDAIMIARGDLGNEFRIEEIPFIESEIIKKCKLVSKPVIVATQMLLSMTENIEPTRAEVTDVSFAITQGADAVMLSEETAIGKHPLEVVSVMEKIVSESENHMKSEVNLLK